MATQLNASIAGSQHNLILPEDCGKFNRKLMDSQLMPAWAIVFKEGQDEAWLPYHLFSIAFHLRPAYDKGKEATLDIHAIPSHDPAIKTTKIFQKGYLIPDRKVGSNMPLGNVLWWQEFHERYEKPKTKQKTKGKEQPEAAAYKGQSGLKIVVKQQRQEEVAQEDDEEEESPRWCHSMRSTSMSVVDSRARSCSSKWVKLTPNEDDEREESGEGDKEVLFQSSTSLNVLQGPLEVIDGPAAANARRESRAVAPFLPSPPLSQDKDGSCMLLALGVTSPNRQLCWGENSTNTKQPINRQAAQVSTPVDLNVQMASPPKAAPKMSEDNDNADNNADDDDSSNKANDSEELPSAVSKGKAWATSPPQSDSSSVESERLQ
ncbi:hypothetical protein BS17DRAFT_763843 [Gyrodon lividus]|nr:hypothetical protein BS17DRAFT_763843 [Gyrodon lividus]